MPVRRRTQRGGAFLKDVHKFLKKTDQSLKKSKFISKVANALNDEGVPFAAQVGRVAGKLGYGKRRGRKPGPKKGRRLIVTGGTHRGMGYSDGGMVY